MDDYGEYRDNFLVACSNGDFEQVTNISKKCDGYVKFCCPVTRENGLHKCARNLEKQEASLQIAEYTKQRPCIKQLCEQIPL